LNEQVKLLDTKGTLLLGAQASPPAGRGQGAIELKDDGQAGTPALPATPAT